MEETKVNGNFAVKVGNMWAAESYNSVSLNEQPESLMSFKNAYKLAEKVGGKIFVFKPKEIAESELENFILASGIKNDEDEK